MDVSSLRNTGVLVCLINRLLNLLTNWLQIITECLNLLLMMWNFLSNYSWRLYLLSNLIKCRGLILDCNSAIRFFSRLRAIMETNRLTRIGLVNLNARTSAFLCILSHSRSKKSKIRPSWDTTRCINNSLILLCRFILRIVSPGDSTREYLSGTYVIINFSSIRTSILIYYFRTLRS